MNSTVDSHWQTVSVLFEQVLATPVAQRPAFLEEACAGDAALREEVEALLEAHEEAEGFFDGLSSAFVAPASAALRESPPDEGVSETQVGVYRIVERIGDGGMSVVYRAERADGLFEQEVAVKVLRAELASGDARRRFLRERQILASLQHAGIARVFDGGVLEEGRPYLVMEYVEGQRLDHYCDDRCLSIAERLLLLLQVCEAVQYAHQNLVVHRDLKPSNVLVTPQGHVKLVDFGIAKLLEERTLDGEDDRTRDGRFWLTPGYAAPEQFAGEAITTATDVYQLGLLAYRLFTGRRAFDVRTRSPREAVQIMLENRPVAPSQVLGSGRDAAEAAAEAETASKRRGTSVEALRQSLRGDLDHIVLKALRRTPERRYASAEALADDLRRHQDGLPVAAQADTWRYRAGKFVRRHRFGMTVAMLLVLLCIGYAGSMAWQMRQTAHERDKAEELAAFMIDLFEVSDPGESVGEVVSARDLLNQGVQQAKSAFEEHPATRAMLFTVTGNIYRRLGLYAEADSLLVEALNVRRRLYGLSHRDVAESLHALGQLRYDQGRYAEAGPLLHEALRIRRRTLGRKHPAVAATLRALGWLHLKMGHYTPADSLFDEALGMRRQLLGADHPDVAQSLSDRAAVFRSRGSYREAERYYRRALYLYRQAYGETHLRVAASLHNLAALWQNQGRYEAAEPYARQALQRYHAILGDSHPDVAASLSNLAYILQKKGDFAVSDSLYREALAMRRQLFGAGHPHVANSLNNLAALLQDQGHYAEALPLANRALDIYRDVYGEAHEQTAQALTTLAWLKRNQGDLREAEALFRKVLEIRLGLYDESHPHVAKDLSYLAELLQARGELQEAEVHFRRALRLLDASVLPEHPSRAIALTGLGDLLTKRGQAREGEKLLREALSLRQAGLPGAHWRTAKTQSALGHCLLVQQRYDEAAPLLEAAFETLEATRGLGDPLTRRAAHDLEVLEEEGAST